MKVAREAMPTSSTGMNRRPPRRALGYTLIELMVVLTIVVLLAGTVVVSMTPALTDARLRAAGRMVIAAFHYARSYAVIHRADTWVTFEMDKNGLGVRTRDRDAETGEVLDEMIALTTTAGRYRRLPEGIAIVAVDKPDAPGSEPTVQFNQFGAAQQAQVTLDDGHGRQRIITLDAITGRCVVENKRNE